MTFATAIPHSGRQVGSKPIELSVRLSNINFRARYKDVRVWTEHRSHETLMEHRFKQVDRGATLLLNWKLLDGMQKVRNTADMSVAKGTLPTLVVPESRLVICPSDLYYRFKNKDCV